LAAQVPGEQMAQTVTSEQLSSKTKRAAGLCAFPCLIELDDDGKQMVSYAICLPKWWILLKG